MKDNIPVKKGDWVWIIPLEAYCKVANVKYGIVKVYKTGGCGFYRRKEIDLGKQTNRRRMIMGFSTVFRYFGLAIELVEEAAEVIGKVKATQDEDSPGGAEITEEERNHLIESMDVNFSNVVTQICRECGLPVESVTVDIKME